MCQQRLPDALYPLWIRKLPAQIPAWKDEASMIFDRGYRPVVSGKLMFVGSTVDHTVRAFDTETGRQRWRFFREGPVRVAPVAYECSVYVASDDGYLYCLAAHDGRLKWKFRAAPSDRRLIGNGQLISTWPARAETPA